MRTCGAEKLPWLVAEVKVDTERAGCLAERQLRLGLVVDLIDLILCREPGTPVRAARTNGLTPAGPWCGAVDGAHHGEDGRQDHQHAPA